ncbi:MAG: DMT family transporter [Candidatus Micrarchaeota archaeon]|nr:DMT family transporter [Candidatus Micrarchaeota archaeon]
MLSLGVVAAIITLIVWSVSLTMERKIVRLSGNLRGSLLIIASGVLPMLLFYAISPFELNLYAIILAVASGIFLALGYILYYKALETEQISNTSGTGLAQPAILIIFGVLALSEAINAVQALAGLLIFVGVIFIITNNKLKFNRKLIPALLANVSWAAYWIFASYAILSLNQLASTLLVARLIALLIVVAIFRFAFKPGLGGRISSKVFSYLMAISVIAGVLDGFGNVTFGIAVSSNLISLAGIFTAAAPLIVTGLSYVVYKERLTKLQGFGMGLAVIGALVLTIF